MFVNVCLCMVFVVLDGPEATGNIPLAAAHRPLSVRDSLFPRYPSLQASHGMFSLQQEGEHRRWFHPRELHLRQLWLLP